MTATDKMRELLDERGIEWFGSYDSDETKWNVGELTWFYFNNEKIAGLAVIQNDITPEQAIDATLGCKTCHCTTPDDAWCFACSACGKSFPRSELSIAHNHGEINYCPNCGAKVVD